MLARTRSLLACGAIVATATASMTLTPVLAQDGSYGGSGSYSGSYRDTLKVVGLAGGGTRLVSFRTDDPGRTERLGTLRGLTGGDTKLVGIDYRVQDKALYGVGDNAASAGVYRIDPGTGQATQVGRLTVALSGTTFGVDFNPAANALRITSGTGQNLRQPFAGQAGAAFAAGTATDGPLNYPGGQPTPVAGPAATGVTGVAYTNNDLDVTTGTTLFDLDTTLDQIAIQSPANSGFLAATGKLTFDFSPDAGFDIYSKLRPMDTGKTVELFPYAVNNPGGTAAELYDVDLLTGAASSDGRIGDPSVTDLAIPLNQL